MDGGRSLIPADFSSSSEITSSLLSVFFLWFADVNWLQAYI